MTRAIHVIDIIMKYGAPGMNGAPAYSTFLLRTRAKDIPPSTMVLIEREWLRLRYQFKDATTVPFLDGITDEGIRMHPGRYAIAAVFNRNELRPKNIEPLYASYNLTMLGQLIIPMTTEGTLVLARKTNQHGQFSGFGAVFDLAKHHETRVPVLDAVTESLEIETGSLADATNVRVLGVTRFDQGDRRGADIVVLAESRFSEDAWRERFETSEQFSRELLFIEPETDALIAALAVQDSAGNRVQFSPSAVAAFYLIVHARYTEPDAERFRTAAQALGYPLKSYPLKDMRSA